MERIEREYKAADETLNTAIVSEASTRSQADEAINEFTVSGNFYDLLENVLMVANDLEFDVTLSSQRMGSPSVLVKDLSPFSYLIS